MNPPSGTTGLNDAQRERKIRSLKRLILAHATFLEVVAACDFLVAQESDEYAEFYGTFFTGICVAYMRPFMSSGLGVLSPKYTTFPDRTDFAKTHQDLKDGRNWAYAHNSPDQAAGLLIDEKQREEQRRVRFILGPTGIACQPPIIAWPKARLPAIAAICQFQIERIKPDVFALIDHLGAGRNYELGEYIIGETFP
jgi:hypothetical protein